MIVWTKTKQKKVDKIGAVTGPSSKFTTIFPQRKMAALGSGLGCPNCAFLGVLSLRMSFPEHQATLPSARVKGEQGSILCPHLDKNQNQMKLKTILMTRCHIRFLLASISLRYRVYHCLGQPNSFKIKWPFLP